MLTSGISAEFGRFGGGVVNAITKSGSNRFSGSFRDNQYKPSWTTQTPFEESRNLERTGPLQTIYEWTLGGPIVRDRLWFFHAGRRQKTTTPAPFPQTGIANSNSAENNRFEIKGTATAFQNHTFQGQFLRNNTAQVQPTFGSRSTRHGRRSHAAERPRRRQLARRAGRQGVRHRPGVAPQVLLREQRRHQHRHPRFAVPQPRLHLGRAGDAALQLAVLRRHRPGEPQQPPDHRQPVVLPDDEPDRHPRHQGRLRELPDDAHRRQLADLDQLRLPDRLPGERRRAGARRQPGSRFRSSCPACRASGLARRAAPSSTSRRSRSRARPLGLQRPTDVRPRRARRVRPQRGHRWHRRGGHARGCPPGPRRGRPVDGNTTFQTTYARYGGK